MSIFHALESLDIAMLVRESANLQKVHRWLVLFRMKQLADLLMGGCTWMGECSIGIGLYYPLPVPPFITHDSYDSFKKNKSPEHL